MINKLNSKQEQALKGYKEDGIKFGLATEDFSLSQLELEKLVNEVYSNGGLAAPKDGVVYLDSIQAALSFISKVAGKSEKEVWSNSQIFYGQHEAHWLQFYSFFNKEVEIKGTEKIIPLKELGSRVGWCWFFDNVAIITRRPTELHMEHNRLHNRHGKAIKYRDGTGFYFMNGVRFNKENGKRFIDTPADSITIKSVLDITNVEQRSEVIKKVGIDKFFSSLPKTLLSEMSVESALDKKLVAFEMNLAVLSYSLYEIQLGNYKPRKALKMNNPSTDEILLEMVHPECTTVEEALLYRNFGHTRGKFIAPRILT